MIDSFAYPMVLLGLLPLAAWAVLWWVPSLRRKREGSFLFPRVSLLAQESRTWRVRMRSLPHWLTCLALGLLIVGLARPQSTKPQEVDVEGIDIYLALDMSGSMQAIDMEQNQARQMLQMGKQPANRFESAVGTLKRFVQSRRHDRIGMVVFAKAAYLQFPLTLDYHTITAMLSRLRLGDINQNGTAIGNALGRALAGLRTSEAKTKIVILITDGDRRGGNISPQQAAESAKRLGVKIFPILVGKEGNALVPVGRNLFSNRMSFQERKFPINPELLKGIARTTGGEYYRATDAQQLARDLHDILDRFERTKLRDTTSIEYNELYRPFVLWALALLCLQFGLRHTLLRHYP